MPMSLRPRLVLSALLAVVASAPHVHAADTPSGLSPAVARSGMARQQPLAPRERGELARRFVLKWGDVVERVYKVPVGVWAQRMVPNFVAADAVNLRRALQRDTLEGALAELNGIGHRLGDARVIDAMARAPATATGRDIEAKLLGDTMRDLTYRPIQPCRILDTRNAGGPIPANGTRSFVAVFNNNVTTSNYTAQGGSSTNCGTVFTGATAVAINLTAVVPSTAGFATVYPFGAPQPLAASVNYSAGAIVNNTVIVRIPSPQAASDFTVYSFAQSHYVADIVGVFSPPTKSPLECRTSGVGPQVNIGPGVVPISTPTCPAGYSITTVYCPSVNDLPGVTLAGTRISFNNGACIWSNTTGATQVVSTGTAVCCRVPGR